MAGRAKVSEGDHAARRRKALCNQQGRGRWEKNLGSREKSQVGRKWRVRKKIRHSFNEHKALVRLFEPYIGGGPEARELSSLCCECSGQQGVEESAHEV
eukprot:760261-Hanusia_phi.AAC.1